VTEPQRDRLSLQFRKIIDALYILKGFATSGRRGADPYRFKIDAAKTYTLFFALSPSVTFGDSFLPEGSFTLALLFAFAIFQYPKTQNSRRRCRRLFYFY